MYASRNFARYEIRLCLSFVIYAIAGILFAVVSLRKSLSAYKALNLHRIRVAEFTACAVVNPRQKEAIACATSQMKGL